VTGDIVDLVERENQHFARRILGEFHSVGKQMGLVKWAATGLCLHRRPETIRNAIIETAQHIYQHTCHKCQRPALTFDRDGATLCVDHAETFIAAPRVEIEEDELW
jgi:hypothetical protein